MNRATLAQRAVGVDRKADADEVHETQEMLDLAKTKRDVAGEDMANAIARVKDIEREIGAQRAADAEAKRLALAAEAKARLEAARLEAEQRRLEEAARREEARLLAEQRAREEHERKAIREAEIKARLEAERAARQARLDAEAEARAVREAEAKARAEAIRFEREAARQEAQAELDAALEEQKDMQDRLSAATKTSVPANAAMAEAARQVKRAQTFTALAGAEEKKFGCADVEEEEINILAQMLERANAKLAAAQAEQQAALAIIKNVTSEKTSVTMRVAHARKALAMATGQFKAPERRALSATEAAELGAFEKREAALIADAELLAVQEQRRLAVLRHWSNEELRRRIRAAEIQARMHTRHVLRHGRGTLYQPTGRYVTRVNPVTGERYIVGGTGPRADLAQTMFASNTPQQQAREKGGYVHGVRTFTNIPGQRDKKVVITSQTDLDGHRTDRHDPLVNTAVF